MFFPLQFLTLYLQAEGGVKAFFKGYTPSLVRAVPVNAAIFMAVFQVKSLME
jgi:hypothetical protein